jgi:hypothetical protein
MVWFWESSPVPSFCPLTPQAVAWHCWLLLQMPCLSPGVTAFCLDVNSHCIHTHTHTHTHTPHTSQTHITHITHTYTSQATITHIPHHTHTHTVLCITHTITHASISHAYHITLQGAVVKQSQQNQCSVRQFRGPSSNLPAV